MAKLTEKEALTSATSDDIIYIVDSPGSIPVSKKMTVENLQQSMKSIPTDSIVSSNSTGWGDIIDDIVAGESLVFPNLVYLKSDGKWWKANASAVATCQGLLGIALESKGADAAIKVLLRGFIRYDTWNWTVGSSLYANTTAGALSHTAPSTEDNVIMIVGIATHANRIYFNPQAIPLEYKA